MKYISEESLLIHVKLKSIQFAKWISGQGWQQYDEADRWICPSNNYNVYTTAQLYEMFEKSKTETWTN